MQKNFYEKKEILILRSCKISPDFIPEENKVHVGIAAEIS